MIKMKKRIFHIFWCFVLLTNQAFGAVYAEFENNIIGTNERAVLTVKSDEETSAQPDLSVLKNLFNVVSTSVSRQTYIINGQTKHEIDWHFVLVPLQKGKIVIEPIVLGDQKTNPLEVTVTDNKTSQNVASNQVNQTAEPLYRVETKIISPKEKKPFIQEQINYEVRIIDDGTLQIESVNFEANEDFIIKELSKPKARTLQNGKREIIFPYALFALKSGKLKLPRAHVQAVSFQMPAAEGFFNNFIQIPFGFGVQTPITLVSDEIETDILPALKDDNTRWWLPAKELSIEARFVNKPQTVRVGTVIKREIIVKAVGLTGEQLPEIETFSNESFKQYPEKPRIDTVISGSDVVGVLYLSDVYIPQKVGVITLPEIKIDWYDILSKQMKTAVLPPEKLHIFKNTNLKEEVKEQTTANEHTVPAKNKNENQVFLKNNLPPYIPFLLAFIGGMFVCYLILKPKKSPAPVQEKQIEEKDIFSSVKKNDLKTLRDRLILWAQTNNKDKKITNLKDVANLLEDADFEKAVNQLGAALYADSQKTSFNIRAFQKTFKKALKNKKKSSKDKNTPIPPLYS